MKNSAGDKHSKKTIKTIEIPVDGSLGLLALGAVGIKTWRKKRAEEKSKENNNFKND